jgi:hypothetical protein
MRAIEWSCGSVQRFSKGVRVYLLTSASVLSLTPAAVGQQGPPIRDLGSPTAVSRDPLASVAAVVEVAAGHVYVNDITAHRLLYFDSSLAHGVVIADSTGTNGESYGERPATLLSFRGDSALLIMPASLSMLVLSPQGRVVRTMAMPPVPSDVPVLIGNIFGTPGFDSRARMIYFAPVRLVFEPRPGNGPATFEPVDSALLVRFDLSTRVLDTVGAIRIPRTRSTVVPRAGQDAPRTSLTAFPPGMIDDWAVTADGRLAIVRGRDYHVDWLDSSDAWHSTARMPYAWERLDDEQKAALIDSAAVALQVRIDSAIASVRQGPAVQGRGARSVVAPSVSRADLADVPDYRPAFGQGAVRGDLNGKVWIRTNKTVDGRTEYDVVNAQSGLIDRVQLPPFRQIAGFGRGVVYLGVRDPAGVTHVERVRTR